ncbi:hypothetical protein PISL3812_07977 [Talaromyces islandicus]|uniref:NAD-dependent epimerase/dehydratase domain-containing protein n=1 Tax=Talaromyces islandicus TaxID=28573 RepID=A0A0U1M7I1_TALIS|nr:hypothetical protein PISL3812_07977 [Talaromyces islandicus]
MAPNILITGAAGYIGGSVLADLLSSSSNLIQEAKLNAVVRSKEQAQSISELGVNVIQLNLNDDSALREVVLQHEIDIVIHTASSMVPQYASSLIQALGERRRVSGNDVYFFHVSALNSLAIFVCLANARETSVTTMFSKEGGWPYGEVRDSDPILAKQKEIEEPNPVRQTDIIVAEESKVHDVKSVNVVAPYVYGRGTGQWRKLSVNIPGFIRTSIAHKTVYKFDTEGRPPAAHISDLVALYVLLLEKCLRKEPIPTGDRGYYFAMAHRAPWWEVMQRLAKGLYARGLVSEPDVHTWPSDKMAAEYLQLPLLYIRPMGTSSGDLVPINAYRLGWEPKWTMERFLDSMDDEIQAVLDLDKGQTSIFGVL